MKIGVDNFELDIGVAFSDASNTLLPMQINALSLRLTLLLPGRTGLVEAI